MRGEVWGQASHSAGHNGTSFSQPRWEPYFPHHSTDRQEGNAGIAQACLTRTQNRTISINHITRARVTGSPNNQRIIGMAPPSYKIVFSRPTSDPKDRMGQPSPPLGFTRVIGDSGTTASQVLHYQPLERHRGQRWFANVVSLHSLTLTPEVLPHTGQHAQHAFRRPPVRSEEERIVALSVRPKHFLFPGRNLHQHG